MNYMDKKERFDKALQEYLHQFKLHPSNEWNTLIGTEEYYLFSLTLVSYPKEDSEPHGFVCTDSQRTSIFERNR